MSPLAMSHRRISYKAAQVNAKRDAVMKLSVFGTHTNTHTHTRQNLYILAMQAITMQPAINRCNVWQHGALMQSKENTGFLHSILKMKFPDFLTISGIIPDCPYPHSKTIP